jgi:4-aminobutyrate aminotransferase
MIRCAAGLATIACIEEDRLLENAREVGAYALERMQRMCAAHALIGDVRGLGLLLGIELVWDRLTREGAGDGAERVMYGALRRGLDFRLTMGNILMLTPPLTISKADMDHALDIVEECLAEIEIPNP